jgi:hypothetical protein
MSSLEEFINFPRDEYCTTAFSIAAPGSGKTYIMINCLKLWIKMNMFDFYILILPQYKNEQNDTYAFLKSLPKEMKKKVRIYETYASWIGHAIASEAQKNCKLFDQGKIKTKPKMCFIVDDATSQTDLFKDPSIVTLVTENRHLQIHSWFLGHAQKGIIEKKVRANIKFMFFYAMNTEDLEDVYKSINFPKDFPKFKDFQEFFSQYVLEEEYGVVLINGRKWYDPNACHWFDKIKN